MQNIKWVFKKIIASFGGLCVLLLVLILATVSFFCVDSVLYAKPSQSYSLGLVNNDKGQYGQVIVDAISSNTSIALHIIEDTNAAEKLLSNGIVEGWVLIPADYTDLIRDGRNISFQFKAAPGSISQQIGREALSNINIQLLIKEDVYRRCMDMYPDYDSCKAAVDNQLQLLDKNISAQYTISTSGGEPKTALSDTLFSKVFAKQAGVVTLFITFCFASMLQYMTLDDVCRVRKRLFHVKKGRLNGYISENSAFILLGILSIVAAKLCMPHFSATDSILMIPFVICAAGMCMCYIQADSHNSSIDMFIPLIVLILCFLGGCFFDVGAVSPVLKVISCITPTGLVLHGIQNNLVYPSIILTCLGFSFSIIGYLRYKKCK